MAGASAGSAASSRRSDPEPVSDAAPATGPGGKRAGGELFLRVISAAVLAPVAIGLAYLGGWLFLALWLFAALAVLWEWDNLVADDGAPILMAAGGAALAIAAALTGFGRPGLGLVAVLGGMMLIGLMAQADRRGWQLAGLPYAAAAVLPAVVLRADATVGFAAILLLFAVVWTTDIAAYFAGRLIGGPKLWARVSPKKTWSGALGGAAGAIAVGTAVAWGFGLGNLAAIAILCLVLSVLSQAGDLFESALKRRFGAKDSGHLLPGHGGLMDRLDGFVVAAAAAALLGVVRGGAEAPARGLLVW